MKTEFEPATDLQSLPLPPGIPVLGNLLQLEATRLHLILEDWSRKYGDFYRLKVVSDWQAVSEILRARPETFRRFSSIETVFGDMGIADVLSAEDEQWYRQRKLTMRAFDPGHPRNYFPSLVKITERLRQVEFTSHQSTLTRGLS